MPLADLPTDPDALFVLLRSIEATEGSEGLDWQLFQAMWELMKRRDLPSDVRAALFNVVGRIDGVVYDGSMEDDLGRAGVSFSFESDTNGALRQQAIVDPDSASLLELRTVSSDIG